MRGLALLLESGIKVRLKAMALRSNFHEMPEIARFCRERTTDSFRLDPFLHLRYDRNESRNEEIRAERLSPQEISAVDARTPERLEALQKSCKSLIGSDAPGANCNHLFHCGAGNVSFSVSYEGLFRLCSSLWHPDCIYNLRKGNLQEAWQTFVPKVRDMRSGRRDYLDSCLRCSIANLCMWCPGRAHLETGTIDAPVDYFCRVAHARYALIGKTVTP